MEFKKAITDINPAFQPQDSYRWAMNKLKNRHYIGLSDDLPVSLKPIFTDRENTLSKILHVNRLPNGDAVVFSVHKPDSPYLFSKVSEIGILDKAENYHTVIADSLLNFDEFKPFQMESILNYDGTNTIIWINGNNPPRMLNLDNPQVQLGTDYALKNPDDIELLNFFLPAKVGSLYDIKVNDAGGSLESGSYFFSFAYETEDGGRTDFLFVFNPIPISNSQKINGYSNYGGCDAGTKTSKSISLYFNKLDTRYKRIILAVIKQVNGQSSAEKIATLSIPQSGKLEYVYTGGEISTPLTLEDVVIKSPTYRFANTLTINNNHCYFASLKNPDYSGQKEANKIQVKWVFDDPVSLDSVGGSFKDGRTVFLKKSFMPGEVVAFYIAWIMNNGTLSPAYHIPGREAKTFSIGDNTFQENDTIADIKATLGTEGDYLDEDLLISSGIKYFHTRDTSAEDGTMAYWENEEIYPEGFPDLAGMPVRHHRFPFLQSLNVYKGILHNQEDSQSFTQNTLSASDTFDAQMVSRDFDDSLAEVRSSDVVNQEFMNHDKTLEITFKKKVVINLSQTLYGQASVTGNSASISSNISIKKGGNTLRSFNGAVDIDNASLFGHIFSKTYRASIQYSTTETIEVNAGETLVYKLSYWKNLDELRSSFDLKISDFEEFTLSQFSGSLYTRSLGVKFSNIHVPDSLKGQVQGFTIFYAKRSLNNSLVLGMSVAFKDIIGNQFRFHSPDLLANNALPSISPDYMREEAYLEPNQNTLSIEQGYTPVDVSNSIKRIKSFHYEPHNTDKNEAAFVFETLSPSVGTNLCLTTLNAHRVTVYSGYTEQELVSTGVIFDANVMETTPVYGGDNFINEYGVRLTPDNANERRVYSFLTWSAVHAGLRQEGEEYGQQYYPKSNIPESFGTPPEGMDENDVDNYVVINPDYTKLNEWNRVYPDNIALKSINTFPNRIVKTPIIKTEGETGAIRRLLPGDYYELTKTKGAIVNIQDIGNAILIHTTESLFKTVSNTKLATSDTEIVLTGTGLFRIPPEEIYLDKEGFAGTLHPEACTFETPGYLFVDERTSSVFLVRESLVDLSNTGNKHWFRENMEFELLKQYSNLPIKPNSPNSPFSIGYTIGYDPVYNRIFVTKRDFVVSTNNGVKQEYPLEQQQMDANFTVLASQESMVFVLNNAQLPVDAKEIAIQINDVIYPATARNNVETTVEGAPDFVIVHKDEVLAELANKNLSAKLVYKTPKNSDYYYLWEGVLFDNEGTPLGLGHPHVEDRSFTVSFDVAEKCLVGEHSHKPGMYFHLNRKLWSGEKDNLYIHNSYTNPVPADSWVDLAIPFNSLRRLQSIFWKADAFNANGVLLPKKTFDEIMVYNSTQCSGYLPLKAVKGRTGYWGFNAFKDVAVSLPFVDKDFNLIPSHLNPDMPQEEQKRFVDSYIIIRFKTFNIEKNYVFLYKIDAKVVPL